MSKKSREIDPENTLLRRDIWIHSKQVGGAKVQIISVRLKSSKDSREQTKGVIIEVYGNETEFDPNTAFKRYLELTKRSSLNSAAFRSEQGWCYTHSEFNKDLKTLLNEFLPYGQITGHSFRSGMASLLASAGYDDDKIQAIGRQANKILSLQRFIYTH